MRRSFSGDGVEPSASAFETRSPEEPPAAGVAAEAGVADSRVDAHERSWTGECAGAERALCGFCFVKPLTDFSALEHTLPEFAVTL